MKEGDADLEGGGVTAGVEFMIGVIWAASVPLIRARQIAVKMVWNCIFEMWRGISEDELLLIVDWKQL